MVTILFPIDKHHHLNNEQSISALLDQINIDKIKLAKTE